VRNNPEGGELDPAYVRGQKKAVIVAAKSGQFTAGQFLRGNRRNLAEEKKLLERFRL